MLNQLQTKLSELDAGLREKLPGFRYFTILAWGDWGPAEWNSKTIQWDITVRTEDRWLRMAFNPAEFPATETLLEWWALAAKPVESRVTQSTEAKSPRFPGAPKNLTLGDIGL